MSHRHDEHRQRFNPVDDTERKAPEKIVPVPGTDCRPRLRPIENGPLRVVEFETEANRRTRTALGVPAGRLLGVDYRFFEVLKLERHGRPLPGCAVALRTRG